MYVKDLQDLSIIEKLSGKKYVVFDSKTLGYAFSLHSTEIDDYCDMVAFSMEGDPDVLYLNKEDRLDRYENIVCVYAPGASVSLEGKSALYVAKSTCPFCHKEVTLVENSNGTYAYECNSCGFRSPVYEDKSSLKKEWSSFLSQERD